MRPPSSIELFRVWEQGLELPPPERALALLTACRDSPEDDPAQCTVGERDGRLLELRRCIFGPEISACVACPECAAEIELNFRVDDVHETLEERPRQPETIADGEYRVTFRLLSAGDLCTLGGNESEIAGLREQLLRRCLLSATRGGEIVSAEQLPEAVVTAISQQMAVADPQAQIELTLKCLECDYQWQENFDIESFFWTEIQAWAGRVLKEVHQLASAYGWSEAEILRLSPLRRHLYLNLIAE